MRPLSLAAACLSVAQVLHAQLPQLPPIRPIGPIEHVSSDSLAAVTHAVPTSGGRVFVNDIVARRALLFDSTLAKATIVADSTGATANAYGAGPATLLPYHGDSALLIVPTALSMLVVSPSGAIVRTLAMPPMGPRRPAGLPPLPFAVSAQFDGRDGMLYTVPATAAAQPRPQAASTSNASRSPDSTFLVRYSLTQRRADTVAVLRVTPNKTTTNRTERGMSVAVTIYAFASVDDWTALADGTIAVIRGRDYHVDWFDHGAPSATPRIPFGWIHLDDSTKRFALDSLVSGLQHSYDSSQSAAAEKAAAQGGGGARAGAPAFSFKLLYEPAEVSELPDYRPPFRAGAVRPDAAGNLWIQTTVMQDKRPVYDVVNRKGELIDRVQLPQFRRIAGFGPGVVYMAVIDSNKVVHLERARIR